MSIEKPDIRAVSACLVPALGCVQWLGSAIICIWQISQVRLKGAFVHDCMLIVEEYI